MSKTRLFLESILSGGENSDELFTDRMSEMVHDYLEVERISEATALVSEGNPITKEKKKSFERQLGYAHTPLYGKSYTLQRAAAQQKGRAVLRNLRTQNVKYYTGVAKHISRKGLVPEAMSMDDEASAHIDSKWEKLMSTHKPVGKFTSGHSLWQQMSEPERHVLVWDKNAEIKDGYYGKTSDIKAHLKKFGVVGGDHAGMKLKEAWSNGRWRSDQFAGHLDLTNPKHVKAYDAAVKKIRDSGIKGIKIDRKGAIAGNKKGQKAFKDKKAEVLDAAKKKWRPVDDSLGKDLRNLYLNHLSGSVYRNVPVTKGLANKARVYIRSRTTQSGAPSEKQIAMAQKIMRQHLNKKG